MYADLSGKKESICQPVDPVGQSLLENVAIGFLSRIFSTDCKQLISVRRRSILTLLSYEAHSGVTSTESCSGGMLCSAMNLDSS